MEPHGSHRFLDRDEWTPAWKLQTGVALTLGGLALVPYVFFADEPPVIYLMSAVALVLGGLSVVVTTSWQCIPIPTVIRRI